MNIWGGACLVPSVLYEYFLMRLRYRVSVTSVAGCTVARQVFHVCVLSLARVERALPAGRTARTRSTAFFGLVVRAVPRKEALWRAPLAHTTLR